jgi:hypothetical protein
MSVTCIKLAYGVGGLSGTEKAVLLAYCWHADEHYYRAWPGLALLCEETSLGRTAVKKAKGSLVEHGFLHVTPRYNPASKEWLTDVVQVDIGALQRSQRSDNKRQKYPDLIERTTTSARPEARGGRSRDDLGVGRETTEGRSRDDLGVGRQTTPKDHSKVSERSSSSAGSCVADRSIVAETVTEEEEEHQDHKRVDSTPPAPVAEKRQQQAEESTGVSETPREEMPSDAARQIIAAVSWHPDRRPGKGEETELAVLADKALADGWTADALSRHLQANFRPQQANYPAGVIRALLTDKLPAPAAPVVPRQAREGMCEKHPYYPAGDCSHCDRATTKGTLPPSAVALLGRIRATAS